MERFKWPVPSDDFFYRTLTEYERSTIQYRVERYKFLWEEFGPPVDMLLVGGIPAMFALDELKRSYAYGSFMATVLLAQAFIEQSLGGSYTAAGRDDVAKKGFADLIVTARSEGHITPKLATTFNRLRRMRNPYSHHTVGIEKRSYMGRMKETKIYDPDDLIVKDAIFAIQTVVDYLRYGSPNWNPGNFTWCEENDS